MFTPLTQIGQRHTGVEIGYGVQAGRVTPPGMGRKGISYRRNGVVAHVEVGQIVQGSGNHHIAVKIKDVVNRWMLHHQVEKCGIRNMGRVAILAEVHLDLDVIRTVVAGGELLVSIVDPSSPEGVVYKVEIDTCVVRTDGFHRGMSLLGVTGIGGRDDGDVAH